MVSENRVGIAEYAANDQVTTGKNPPKGLTMAKYVIQSKRAEPPQGAYSQGWRAGDFIFVPGTGPVDPATGKIVGDTIEQQTEQTITNIAAVLEADGASLSDIVKVTAHLSDSRLFSRYNAAYARRFSPPYPVRTSVGSSLAMSPGMLVEIDCIAYKPQAAGTSRRRAKRTSRTETVIRGRSAKDKK